VVKPIMKFATYARSSSRLRLHTLPRRTVSPSMHQLPPSQMLRSDNLNPRLRMAMRVARQKTQKRNEGGF